MRRSAPEPPVSCRRSSGPRRSGSPSGCSKAAVPESASRPFPTVLRRRWPGMRRLPAPAAMRSNGASRRSISCAVRRGFRVSAPPAARGRHRRGTCCSAPSTTPRRAPQWSDSCPPVPPYRTFVNRRFQRMFAGNDLFASSDSQTNEALPTIWSSGTKPQNRESAELWRLSPIIQ